MKLGKKILSAVVAVMMLLSIAPAASAATYDADYCYSEGYDVAVQIGAEGSVLLKNKDNLLPLAEGTKVTVLGAMSYNYVEGGTGSAGGADDENTVLMLDALLEAADRQNRELAFLPRWEARQLDLTAAYNQRMREAGKKGYGMFAKHHVFTVENGQLVPVKYPDPQKLSELPGYEKEREKVIANTRALLAGSPANNVLLYGDAGTGKSSTVKAIANEYAADGLRLVEVKKNQLYQIPDLMDQLAANPLKFILFIDDLSFSSNDDNFAALKAILEGSVGGRARNIAVYATSNRRHLIKETLTDRTGDDIHEADTRQELMSLSARFGLTVTFQRPEKARFAAILEELAKQHHIQMPMEELLIKAEAFAIRAGGRSPRVAKQFIEQCESGVQK